MPVTVTMPQLGESVTEGTIQQWLKQPGDPVELYESLAEVNTDKVNAEIPSPVAGTMGEHLVGEGAVVPVGQPICRIEGVEASADATAAPAASAPAPAQFSSAPAVSTPSPTAPASAPATSTPVPATSTPAPAQFSPAPAASAPAPAASTSAPATSTPVPALSTPAPAQFSPAPAGSASEPAGALHLTPAVRMLVREHDIDLTQLTGSGIAGRITKKDVLEYVQRRDATEVSQPRPEPVGGVAARRAEAVAQAPAAPAAHGDTAVPLTPMRRAIAEHMSRSVQTSPHAWTMVEVDMTPVARIRAARREEFRARSGVDLTFLPFVAKAVIAALRQHPTLNATWTDAGVLLKRDINLGIAVALDDGLVVPVIKGADRLSLSGLALAAQDLGDRARAGRLRVDDVEGGTFTLNNAGALGTVMSQAIINQPQAAILVMDAVVKRPVVVAGDAIAVRSMMNLCISFDHRINDGLPIARFLHSIKATLEAIEDAAADLW